MTFLRMAFVVGRIMKEITLEPLQSASAMNCE